MFEIAFAEAKKHARAVYPEEMCGFVIKDKFVPVQNNAADPSTHVEEGCACRLCTFIISSEDTLKYLSSAQMILHSHPNGNQFPSKRDMEAQMSTDIPWGVMYIDEDHEGSFEVWGESLPIAPLLGREFMHGIRDCYSLIRDIYRTGKDELAAQDITQEWPFDSISLIDMARADGWWTGEDDFYSGHFADAGFVEIDRSEARAGDCFMMKFRSDKFNHAGVLITSDLVMHHLSGRLSRREPAGGWSRVAGRWLRYVEDAK